MSKRRDNILCVPACDFFLEWGITFEEPYIVPERADRAVAYANREDLEHNLPKSNKAEDVDVSGAYAVSGRGGMAHEPAVDKPRRRGRKADENLW